MRNPFKKLFKERGYPDSSHIHHGTSSSSSSSSSSSGVIPSSAPLPPSPVSSALSLPPAGYPSTNNHAAGYGNMVQPPTAYPYNPPPPQDSEQVWEIDAGRNINMKGNQKAGNVRAANNAAPGCAPAINIPQKGRFVINAGGNTNYGHNQETGNVEFANIG